jgi:hypothetical protein
MYCSKTNLKVFFCSTLAAALLFIVQAPDAAATARDQTKRIHDRLTGVPPSASFLDTYAVDADNDGFLDDPLGVAKAALEQSTFYTVTVKNMIAPATNEEQTVFTPLNDFTATAIGLIRDELDYRQLLYGDIIYTGDSSLGLPPYANNNNNHYEQMEEQGIDLADENKLVRRSQSSVTGLPAYATAGVITSRAAAKEFFKDGTNRAMFRFMILNQLCVDLEQIKDVSRSSDRIRQDVTRSPGGDSRIFFNACGGCHAGMDPLAQGMAYYDYDYDTNSDPDGEFGQLSFNDAGSIDPETGTRVKAKYLINSGNFKWGYVTPDDQWDNYWRQGPNALLGWDSALSGSGSGAKSMGRELAHTQAFAQCQVKKVFKTVCLREPGNSSDRSQIDSMVGTFTSGNYNLKEVFAESAVYCMGD